PAGCPRRGSASTQSPGRTQGGNSHRPTTSAAGPGALPDDRPSREPARRPLALVELQAPAEQSLRTLTRFAFAIDSPSHARRRQLPPLYNNNTSKKRKECSDRRRPHRWRRDLILKSAANRCTGPSHRCRDKNQAEYPKRGLRNDVRDDRDASRVREQPAAPTDRLAA